MPNFNTDHFIATQLRFIISLSFALLLFTLTSRIILLFWLAPQEAFSEYTQDFFSTFVYSIRWDLKIFSILLSPIFLISFFIYWNNTLKKYGSILIKLYSIIFVVLTITLTLGNALYWQTYANPLDILIFGLIEDDTTEVLKVLWNDYHPIYFSIVLIIITYLTFFIAAKFNKKLKNVFPYFYKWKFNIPINISAFFILFALARGSFSLFPLIEQTTLASDLNFLNQLAISPAQHLSTTIINKKNSTFATTAEFSLKKRGYNSINQATESLLFKGDKTEFGVPLVYESQSTYNGVAPNIIFVLMEGWSSQIVFDKQQPENFLGEFKQHIPKGLFYKNFVSTRQGTLRFLESTLTNTSFFNLSTSAAYNYPFKYSNVTTLKNLGFELGFIRGGSRQWYNQGNFWSAQGFDSYWDMNDIMKRYNVDKFSDWGVHDEYGFAFALEKAQDYSKTDSPYFLLVETTTNHPPHVLPKHYKEIGIKSEHFLDNAIKKENTELQINTAQYMTEQLGQFLTNLENKHLLDNTIVIATGDHTMWAFYNYSQTQDRLLNGAVPLYVRLPETIKPEWSDENITASHRDIFPTLFELAYPKAKYLKTGFDLFDENSLHAGWHERNLWIMDNLASINATEQVYEFDEDLKINPDKSSTSKDMQKYKSHIRAIEALIQWQFKKEFEHSN